MKLVFERTFTQTMFGRQSPSTPWTRTTTTTNNDNQHRPHVKPTFGQQPQQH